MTNIIGLTDKQCELLWDKIHECETQIEYLINDISARNGPRDKSGLRPTQMIAINKINRSFRNLKEYVLKNNEVLTENGKPKAITT